MSCYLQNRDPRRTGRHSLLIPLICLFGSIIVNRGNHVGSHDLHYVFAGDTLIGFTIFSLLYTLYDFACPWCYVGLLRLDAVFSFVNDNR